MTTERAIPDDEPVCVNCNDDGCPHCEDVRPVETPETWDDDDDDWDDEDDWDDDYDDSMDGDFDSAMRDAGWGTDEDYGCYGPDDEY